MIKSPWTAANARRLGNSSLSTPSQQPQLVFELSSAAADEVLHNGSGRRRRRCRPSVSRGHTFAAIENFGQLEVLQRATPVHSLKHHLSKPAAFAGKTVLHAPEEVRRFVAGAVAGAVSKTATAPLEQLRMQLMTGKASSRDIIRQTWMDGGVGAFFGGNAADVLRVMPSKAIELMAFDAYKTVLRRRDRPAGPVATTVGGALAGLTATLACFPLETVRTRMAIAPREYRSIVNCFQKTVGTRGFGALYQGVSASAIGAVPYSALRFGAYDGLKWAYRKRFKEDMPPQLLPVAGAVAGLAASTATFPLEVVRRRMMAGAGYSSVLVAIQTIAAEEGWRSLYRGLGVSLIKQAPQTGITLWAYDTAKGLMKV